MTAPTSAPSKPLELWRWLTQHSSPLGALLTLVTLTGLLWGGVRVIFATPDLAVTATQTPLEMPRYLLTGLTRALDRDSAQLSDSLAKGLRDIRGFLRDTRNYTQLTLVNTTDHSLRDIDVRIRSVQSLDGWGVRGDWVDDGEKQRILDAVHFDYPSSLVTVRGISRLPPNSTTTLFLWGEINYHRLLAEDRITVTYDGGAGEIIPERVVTGLNAFVYSNSGLLLIVLIFGNMFAFDFLRRREPQTTSKDS